MNNKSHPLHIFPVLISHAFQGCRTHTCPFFQYSSIFFLLRGNYYTHKHTRTFFPYGCFWVMTTCSVCHRSEAKVNQIEYSCPLCVSFHLSPGFLSFTLLFLSFSLGLQTGLLWVCVRLLYPHEHTHVFDLWTFHYVNFKQYMPLPFSECNCCGNNSGTQIVVPNLIGVPNKLLKSPTVVTIFDTGQTDTLNTHFLEQNKTLN